VYIKIQKKILKLAGIDHTISSALILKAISMIGGLLIILFISKFLTPNEQGYFYTINSLIALQVFFELGLNLVIIQFSSHEMKHMQWGGDGVLEGDELAKGRIKSLARLVALWFVVVSIVLIVIVIPTGMLFFNNGDPESPLLINIIWSTTVLAVAASMLLNGMLALLEGCHKVVEANQIRSLMNLANIFGICSALYTGLGLMSVAVGATLGVLIGIYRIYRKFFNFYLFLFCKNQLKTTLNWKEEIFPFQWRIALSWMSGYLAFQIYNPVLFKVEGSSIAGQMGMSLQIIFAINGLTGAWITSKMPYFGTLISQNKHNELKKLFRNLLIKSLTINLILVFMFCVSIYTAGVFDLNIAKRLLSIDNLIILSIACIANHITFCLACYMRAHLREPLLRVSILSGFVTLTLVILIVPIYGVNSAVYIYFFNSLFIGLFGSTYAFKTHLKIKQNEYI